MCHLNVRPQAVGSVRWMRWITRQMLCIVKTSVFMYNGFVYMFLIEIFFIEGVVVSSSPSLYSGVIHESQYVMIRSVVVTYSNLRAGHAVKGTSTAYPSHGGWKWCTNMHCGYKQQANPMKWLPFVSVTWRCPCGSMVCSEWLFAWALWIAICSLKMRELAQLECTKVSSIDDSSQYTWSW